MFFQKLKQQVLDNLVLLILLAFAACGTFKSTQVKVELGNLAELQTRIADLETRCTDIERMREDMDDLRYAFAKAVTARPARVVNKPK
jgi:Tfp pilus assembly protein PilN